MTDKSQISIRALSIKPSLTLEISAKAKALKAEGKNICSLSAGEPDFETPEFIIDATLKALKDGKTRYGPAAGDPELREAIAQKQSNINKVPTKIDNVLVTNGGNLVNNLDLAVKDPSGTWTNLSNNVDNLLGLTFTSPAQGQWEVHVIGTNVPTGPQKYALVIAILTLQCCYSSF